MLRVVKLQDFMSGHISFLLAGLKNKHDSYFELRKCDCEIGTGNVSAVNGHSGLKLKLNFEGD